MFFIPFKYLRIYVLPSLPAEGITTGTPSLAWINATGFLASEAPSPHLLYGFLGLHTLSSRLALNFQITKFAVLITQQPLRQNR